MKHSILVLAGLLLLTPTASAQNRRETVVRQDRKQVEADTTWIYNDLQRGMAAAKTQGKPLLVLIRCIP